MHPKQLLSCYPPQSLTTIIDKPGIDTLHIYVDLKNVMTALFVQEVVNEMVSKTQTMKTADSFIFQSCLFYIGYWKEQAKQRGLNVKIFFTTDVGRSNYHKAINRDYKKRRELDPAKYGPTDIVLKEIRDKNFKLCEQICNKVKDTYFFCLEHLESDFLPYYLISRKFKDQNNIFHIVCSNDKDLYQTLLLPNTVQIYKIKGVRNLLVKEDMMFKFLKVGDTTPKNIAKKMRQISELDPHWISVMMALTGDETDDIPGLERVGPSTTLDMLDKKELVEKVLGTYDEVIDRVNNDGKVFLEDKVHMSQLPSKAWKTAIMKNDLVTDSLKQISFELLCKWLEKKNSTTKINYLKYIDKITSKENISLIQTPQVFFNTLNFLEDNMLTEDAINSLFL